MQYAFPAFFILLIVALFFSAMRDFISMIWSIPAFQKIRFTHRDLDRFRIALAEIPYYQKLTPADRERFLMRVISFMINKTFEGKDGMVVTEKMKLQIAAAAVQLTFGLNNYIFPHFHQIYIFPGEFGYPGKNIRMKGGTSESGKIYLSWKDFQSGMVLPDDGYNLGLHEFAHALKIEYTRGANNELSFNQLFPHWYSEGLRVMQEMKEGRSTFLRQYASTNPHEFFAVCVERFFETPVEFREKLPRAYFFLSALLLQDPANNRLQAARQPSFATAPAPPVPFARISPGQAASWHWSLSILLSALFLGIPFFFWTLSRTDITTLQAVFMIIAAGSANLFTWNYFREREILNRSIFVLYSYAGVGIWFAVFVFAMNFIAPIGETVTEDHRIVGSSMRRYNRTSDHWTTLELQQGAYDNSGFLRTFYRPGQMGPVVRLEFRRGIFGLRSLHHYSFP